MQKRENMGMMLLEGCWAVAKEEWAVCRVISGWADLF